MIIQIIILDESLTTNLPASPAAPAVPAPPTTYHLPTSTTNKQSDQQPFEFETILALLIFMCFYALISTLFLCYYCMGFSCVKKTKTSPVPNIVPATAPVSSNLAQIVFSPLSTVLSPSTVSYPLSPSSTVFSPESCSEYLSPSSTVFSPQSCSEYPSSFSSTYGPSFMTASNDFDCGQCESFV
jgi:hypothetical protein